MVVAAGTRIILLPNKIALIGAKLLLAPSHHRKRTDLDQVIFFVAKISDILSDTNPIFTNKMEHWDYMN